jgi:hypothetical protein
MWVMLNPEGGNLTPKSMWVEDMSYLAQWLYFHPGYSLAYVIEGQ